MRNIFQEKKSVILNELETSLDRISDNDIDRLVYEIKKADSIFVTGAGRMGIVMSTFSMRLNHLGFVSHIVGSINCPPITKEDLLLVASSSGETVTIKDIAFIAKSKGATIGLLTAAPESTIGKAASSCTKIDAPSSLVADGKDLLLSQQPMKTLFEQTLFIVLETVILILIQQKGESIEKMAQRHANLE